MARLYLFAFGLRYQFTCNRAAERCTSGISTVFGKTFTTFVLIYM